MKTVTNEQDWQHIIELCGAQQITSLINIPPSLNSVAVWLETDDFGYLFSPKNAEGKRTILAKF